jgi:hypothetical protein
MNAFCVLTSTSIAPFDDPVGEARVGGQTLASSQVDALAAAGFTVVDVAPDSGPVLLFSDRTWFTSAMLHALKKVGHGRAQIDDPGWLSWHDPLLKMSHPGVYELAISSAGVIPFEDIPAVVLPLSFQELDLGAPHPSAMAQQVDHWSHIVRANHLALAARMEVAREDWEQAGVFGKAWRLLCILWRARSLNGWKIAASLTERGKDVKVHPTAVVEFSVLQEGCDIGPHAVIRGSVIGKGAKVDAHANVNASVVDAGAKVGRYGFLNLCTVYPGAFVSSGDGFQASVFGRESFMAWGSTVMDLSFGASIKVERSGVGTERIESGHHFLGAAIGHRAVVGHGVKVRYGASIPNDAMLVDDSDQLREWGAETIDGPAVIRDGLAVPLKPQD